MSLMDMYNLILPQNVVDHGSKLRLVVEPSFGVDDRHNMLYWAFLENQPDFVTETARSRCPEMPQECNNVLADHKEIGLTNIYFQW